jgi:methionyl-tRNA synthetase
MRKNVLIGVAWPYVNGELHIGHLAGYLLPADITARYNRLIGNNVLMVSGSDCFGTPITVEADKKGVAPKEIVDTYHDKHVELLTQILGLTYDLYTKTDQQEHITTTQDIFVKLAENGYIFVDNTEQYFSASENRFLPDRYVIGKCPYCGYLEARSDQCDNCGKLIAYGELIEPRSNLSGDPVEFKETQHYFMDWPKLQDQLIRYVETVSGEWKEWVRNETQAWLRDGLKPRAVTRDLDWGVPIPVDRIPENMGIENTETKRIYVWFDAVIGYLSASKQWASANNKKWEDYWYGDGLKHYYFMGKDNLVFHTLFWPGQLMGYDSRLHLPDLVSINMFLNYDGRQFSKSRGVSVDIKEIVEKFGNDAVRFHLTLIMPETKDSSFNWSDFKEKVNGILVATLGNFIHRVLSIGKNVDLEGLQGTPVWPEVEKEIAKVFERSRKSLDNCEFRNYLDAVLKLASFGNSLVDKEKLWELKTKDEKRFKEVIKQLYIVIIALGYLMTPLLPDASCRLFKMLGVEEPKLWPETGKEAGFFNKEAEKISVSSGLKPLFEKIDYQTE